MKGKQLVIILSAAIIFLQSCHRKETLFTDLPSSTTNIEFTNQLQDRKAFGILYYLYYFNGGGVSTGDINNDGLTDIYFTANSKGNNKLYLNKGNFVFEDITDKAGVKGTMDWASGVTMADVNGDGFLDIYVSAVANHHGLTGHNELYINNGSNTFKESSAEYGLNFSGFTSQSAFFDFDHDGDLDCYVLNQSHKPNQNIVDTSNRRKFDPNAGDRFYRNDRTATGGRFTDITAAAGISQSNLGYGLGLAVADVNNDGWEDIYIGNDFHENDYYYVNNGNGTFTESGAKYFDHYSRFSMGNDIADYNNDGQLDLVTVDMLPPDEKVLKTYGSDENPDIYKFKLIKNGFQYQYSRNSLQHNNGDGKSFSETALLSGVPATDWSWAPLFADFDNDGKKDLFISSGIPKRPVDLDYIRFASNMYVHQQLNSTDKYDKDALDKMPDGSSHPYFFKGDGDLAFTDVSDAWGTGKLKGYYTGAAYADLDNDGRLDMIINPINSKAIVLKNNAPVKNYISISFKGTGGNRNGIGAKAWVYANGHMQYQQVMLTRGFQSSVEPRLHFGLDSTATIDSVVIVWPDQHYQTIVKPAINKPLVADQAAAAGTFSQAIFHPAPVEPFRDVTPEVLLPWAHRENNFEDFNSQYLIPHGESQRGPRVAVADINGDQLDDFYACGAKGQPGVLFVQQANGTFKTSDEALFAPDAGSEDVDAVFADVNADGFPDLYVASGGNELTGQSPELLDRLYLNDGKGHFTKTTGMIPAIYQNKSCIAAADVDGDKDLDLFVGVLADAGAYGKPQTSYLLLNDGTGKFSVAPPAVINLSSIGMVTAAAFTDPDKDGLPDLVVTGEWMPVVVYHNRDKKFTSEVIGQSTGLWQSLLVRDVNGDGIDDVLAGNWGYNNKFWSGKDGPLRMYAHDMDRNGKTDQLLSYMYKGVEYPFLAKDEVERQLPLLKKHYLLYSDYAGVPMKDVFYGWIDTVPPVTAERLGSAVFFGSTDKKFTISDLPKGLQMAPVFSFCDVPGGFLAGGNFYDVTPYEGRYDAQALRMFTFSGSTVQATNSPMLASVKGQVRDIKWIRTAAGPLLVVARNNEPLLFYRSNNK
ncbi:MAG: RNA-binding protein [Chitinophagaceae bacterium]|nr:MAG: RNA-binding protein [Chitinophagaceae bacterium]